MIHGRGSSATERGPTYISDPAAPILRGQLFGIGGGKAADVAVDGDRAYVVAGLGNPDPGGMIAVDIADCLIIQPDLDGSGTVDSADLNLVLSGFGCGAPPCEGDANHDGATNSLDLNAVLAAFGQPAP